MVNLTPESGPKDSRKLPCWIDSFVQSTEHTGSPKLYRKWAGYLAVSAALQRKVFVVVRGRELYPNLFAILVGPPGVGKTTVIRAAREILIQLPSIQVSPTMVTKERFINLMTKAQTVEVRDGAMTSHVSYNAICDEFAVFLRPGDQQFSFVLTDLFDCPTVFEYETITRGKDRIENVYLNILGGITPKSLASVIGQEAIGMGFTARLFLIYAEEQHHTDPFSVQVLADYSPLVRDLEIIHQLRGAFSFTTEAMEFVRDWYNKGMSPVPADSRFAEYNPRRLTHWLKLGLLRCASRCNERRIEAIDLARAKEDLLEAELLMPKAMESIGANPLQTAISGATKWLAVQYMIRKQPIPEMQLRQHLIREVPPQYLDSTIEMMVSSGTLVSIGGSKPSRLFTPGAQSVIAISNRN